MVKGISRQVIVVHSPDKKLFDQAIFILKDSAVEQGGVTDAMLLKEAKRLISGPALAKKRKLWNYGLFWAILGAAFTGTAWLLSALLLA